MTDTNNHSVSDREYKRDEKDCVIRAQPETHVYLNPYGEIVIRQANWPDEDMWVYFAPDHLPNVVERMCEWAGEDARLAVIDRLRSFVLCEREADGSANDQPARRDPTAADRQRRYRERKRANDGQLQMDGGEQQQTAEAAE
ncbi:hypothetical protein [Bradyrhizobium cenepequi]